MKKIFLILLASLFFIACSSDDDSIEKELIIDEPLEITVTTSNLIVTIDENPAPNQTLGTIQGITNEGNVTFSVLNESPSGAISINSMTGELIVSNETLFDFETYPVIKADINVVNGSVVKVSMVTILLKDLNETTITGAWSLINQEAVDNFGASGYTENLYNLYIDDSNNSGTPITSLLPLTSLLKVGQFLYISNCQELTSLEGLNNLESVGSLRIYNNSNLTNLNGLDNLTSIVGDAYVNDETLEIYNNASLTSLDGIENLTNINKHVYISNNSSLTNINGLSGLLNVGGYLSIGNPSLFNLCGITNLFQNSGLVGDFNTTTNGYSPTIDDILNGDCQL